MTSTAISWRIAVFLTGRNSRAQCVKCDPWTVWVTANPQAILWTIVGVSWASREPALLTAVWGSQDSSSSSPSTLQPEPGVAASLCAISVEAGGWPPSASQEMDWRAVAGPAVSSRSPAGRGYCWQAGRPRPAFQPRPWASPASASPAGWRAECRSRRRESRCAAAARRREWR